MEWLRHWFKRSSEPTEARRKINRQVRRSVVLREIGRRELDRRVHHGHPLGDMARGALLDRGNNHGR